MRKSAMRQLWRVRIADGVDTEVAQKRKVQQGHKEVRHG